MRQRAHLSVLVDPWLSVRRCIMQFRLFFLFFFLINARYLLVTGNRIDDHPICVQNVIDTNKIAAVGTNIPTKK
ncbi:hypothetical protein F4824DRAFT_444478 [Ustulina deusta]|nr:hypothetical protein F4824DRAFT_444478 [Ustulina deusta]